MQDHEGSEGRYVGGCKCRPCLDAHAATQRQYRAGVKVKTETMKAELRRLQALEARMLAAIGQHGRVTS